jgi:hypothetical protein
LTLVPGVGFIDAEEEHQIGQLLPGFGVIRKVADDHQALPLSAGLGSRRGSRTFRWLDGPAEPAMTGQSNKVAEP